jgi:hypothetical protein
MRTIVASRARVAELAADWEFFWSRLPPEFLPAVLIDSFPERRLRGGGAIRDPSVRSIFSRHGRNNS